MNAKYYVESGRALRTVVLAADELDAICKAVALAAASRPDEPLPMANLIIVSQRGFVWDRPDRQLYGDEFILPTRLVLGEPEEMPAQLPSGQRARKRAQGEKRRPQIAGDALDESDER
jgi:hypothetical protein